MRANKPTNILLQLLNYFTIALLKKKSYKNPECLVEVRVTDET